MRSSRICLIFANCRNSFFDLSFSLIFDIIIESYEFKLTDADVFLIIIASMYISAKYEGDKRKLTIEKLVNDVAKNKFTKKRNS